VFSRDGGEMAGNLLERTSLALNEKLAVIKAALDMAEDRLDGVPGAGEFLSVINRACYSIMKLADDLELMSRGAGQGDRRIFHIALLFRRLMDTVAYLTRNAGVSLSLQSDPESIPVRADRRHMQRLVLNLLSNSVKYARGGRITVTLRRVTDG
jgi:signal transduction histidine kinase